MAKTTITRLPAVEFRDDDPRLSSSAGVPGPVSGLTAHIVFSCLPPTETTGLQPSSEPQASACANSKTAGNHTLAEASRGLKPRGSVRFRQSCPAILNSQWRRTIPRQPWRSAISSLAWLGYDTPGRGSLTARSHAMDVAGNGSGWKQSSPPTDFRCRGQPGRQRWSSHAGVASPVMRWENRAATVRERVLANGRTKQTRYPMGAVPLEDMVCPTKFWLASIAAPASMI